MTSKATDDEVETPEAETAEVEAPEIEDAEPEIVEAAEPAPAVTRKTVKAEERRRFRVSLDDRFLAIVVLLALTASVVTAAFMWKAWSGTRSDLDTQKDVRARAGEYANAFLTYDHQDLDGWQKRLEELSTPDYRKAMSGALAEQRPIILSTKAVATTTIRDVFIAEVDGNLAKAIVISDHEVKSTGGTATQAGMRTYLELVERKGVWLVNGLGYQGLDSQSAVDPDGKPLTSGQSVVPTTVPTAQP